MVFMVLPILNIDPHQSFVSNNQHILSIFLLGRFGEVEGAGDHHGPIDDHDLVVSDGMLGIDVGEDLAFFMNVADVNEYAWTSISVLLGRSR
jgi:hypothetical protein